MFSFEWFFFSIQSTQFVVEKFFYLTETKHNNHGREAKHHKLKKNAFPTKDISALFHPIVSAREALCCDKSLINIYVYGKHDLDAYTHTSLHSSEGIKNTVANSLPAQIPLNTCVTKVQVANPLHDSIIRRCRTTYLCVGFRMAELSLRNGIKERFCLDGVVTFLLSFVFVRFMVALHGRQATYVYKRMSNRSVSV